PARRRRRPGEDREPPATVGPGSLPQDGDALLVDLPVHGKPGEIDARLAARAAATHAVPDHLVQSGRTLGRDGELAHPPAAQLVELGCPGTAGAMSHVLPVRFKRLRKPAKYSPKK